MSDVLDDALRLRLPASDRIALDNLAAEAGCGAAEIATAMIEARVRELAGVFIGLRQPGGTGRRAAARAAARLAERGKSLR